MKWFQNITTLDELRSEYRRLALLHHPDKGGSTADMQEISRRICEMAAAGLRVLAIARKDRAEVEDAERRMTFLGLVGMMDPPREEAIRVLTEEATPPESPSTRSPGSASTARSGRRWRSSTRTAANCSPSAT